MIALRGRVFPVTSNVIEGGTVLIDDGKIVDVGSRVNIPSSVKVIDVGNSWIVPGFIDAHTHLGVSEEGVGPEGNDINESVDPLTPHLRVIDAINPLEKGLSNALSGGVTACMISPGSANVIGGEIAVVKTHGTFVERIIMKAPVGLKVAFGENPKRVYGGQSKMPSTRMGTAAVMREAFVKAVEYMEKRKRFADSIDKLPERDLKMETLVKVLTRQIPLRAHAHRADDIFTAIRIADEFNLDIVIDHATEGHKVAGELVARNISAVVGPTFGVASKVETNELSFKTPGLMSKAGIKVAIMSDHPVVPSKYLPIYAALAVKEGMDSLEAIKAITINAAEILGVSNRVGSLEPGKDADIAVFTGHPFNIMSQVTHVYINGEPVYNNE